MRVNNKNPRTHFKLSNVTFNDEKLNTRKETLDGVEYLVAPVVMVKQQVLNGEFLPADEIRKSTLAWNGRPVVVFHPINADGDDTLANQPEVVEKYEIGKLYNAEYDEETTKLKVEAWIDIEKARAKNDDTKAALEMIENSEKLEVSTGYVVYNLIEIEGDFEDTPYFAVQRDIMPDHLALLPGQIGACSWEDGAGVRNNNASNKAINALFTPFVKVFNDLVKGLKHNQTQSLNDLLLEVIRDEINDSVNYIRDIYFDTDIKANFVVFDISTYDGDANEGMWTCETYSIDFEQNPETGSITLGGNLNEVEPVVQYISEKNNKNKEENFMAWKTKANTKPHTGKGKGKSNDLTKKTKAKDKKVKNGLKDFVIEQNADLTVTAADLLTMTPEEIVTLVEGVAEPEALQELRNVLNEAVTSLADTIEVVDEALIDYDDGDDDSDDPATNDDPDDGTDDNDSDSDDDDDAEPGDPSTSTNRRKNHFNGKKPQSMNSFINSIPDTDLRAFITNGQSQMQKARKNMINRIVANKAGFTVVELNSMPYPQIEKIFNMVSKSDKKVNYGVNGVQGDSKSRINEGGGVPLSVNIFNANKEDE